MVHLAQLAAVAFSCLVLHHSPEACVRSYMAEPAVQLAPEAGPRFTGEALDVVLTAQAALVWDRQSQKVLYERNSQTRRPVASLAKLASVVVARERLAFSEMVVIPPEAAVAQRRGANIKLPVGEYASVKDLLGASLTASANDAVTALAVAASGSEAAFVASVNTRLPVLGIHNTKLANATGLQGGEQFSTAQDIRTMLTLLTKDATLRQFLAAPRGTLTTQEGSRRAYMTTNKLLGTYLPVLSAKTGYTVEAGQNLALLTRTASGHEIGAVVLGSDERFQDMKILVEWINRNYTW